MLQQTQVSTVIPYYRKFIARFPDLAALESCDPDELLHYWSGLGYYARARNLHAAAKKIVEQHHGKFPDEFDQVLALPGIGRSTAAAILAFAHGQRHAILDGNVKRVLTRYYAIEGYAGSREVEARLWKIAERLTPNSRVADYTQAFMDLGATVCLRTKPLCAGCPLAADCRAHRHGDPTAFPRRKPKAARPRKAVTMLIVKNARSELLLVKRPPSGIWGGLWSLPEYTDALSAPPEKTVGQKTADGKKPGGKTGHRKMVRTTIRPHHQNRRATAAGVAFIHPLRPRHPAAARHLHANRRSNHGRRPVSLVQPVIPGTDRPAGRGQAYFWYVQ